MVAKNFSERRHSSLVLAICSTVVSAALATSAAAEGGVVKWSSPAGAQRASEIIDYWTPERMKAATPLEAAKVPASTSRAVTSRSALGPAAVGNPTVLPGWDPKSGKPQPTMGSLVEYDPDSEMYRSLKATPRAIFGTGPTNPIDYGAYGPFQRWTWYAAYLIYPTSTIGKMFFSHGEFDFVCSGTVIGLNMFITAGHCVSDGAGNFASNIMFCPSYNAGGVNANRGCWAGVSATVSGAWHTSSDFDRDYACVVTSTTGTLFANNMGNLTGWLGVATNFGVGHAAIATGYPAAAPFPGYHIIFTSGTEWYAFDTGGDTSAYSKYMGNDMTGGSSGGSWWLGIAHATAEWPVVDDTALTDPTVASGAQPSPVVNGVNSHKRCADITCGTPPTATTGVFWDEMASPNFTSSESDGADVLDIVNTCAGSGGL